MPAIEGKRRASTAREGASSRLRRAVAMAVVASLWLASPAVSQQEEEVALFIVALEALGCSVISDTQAEVIEERTGLDHDMMSAIVAILLQDGRLELLETMDGIRLTTPGCE